MDKIRKIAAGLFAFILLCPAVVFASPRTGPDESLQDSQVLSSDSNVTIYFFYGDGCPHCDNVMPFMSNISQKFPNETFVRMEIFYNTTNRNFADRLNGELNITSPGVPEVIVGKTVLIGDKDIPARLEQVILEEIRQSAMTATQSIQFENGPSLEFTLGGIRLLKNETIDANASCIMNIDLMVKNSNISPVDVVFMISELTDSSDNGVHCDSPHWCGSLVFMEGIQPGESRTGTSKVTFVSTKEYDDLSSQIFLLRNYIDITGDADHPVGGLKYNEWLIDLKNSTLSRLR
jgi:thiol-disulfide isomerase/thioredoxin